MSLGLIGTFLDINLFTHLNPSKEAVKVVNPVDGHGVPVPHFGVVLEWDDWHKFADKLKAAKIKFVIEPYVKISRCNR